MSYKKLATIINERINVSGGTITRDSHQYTLLMGRDKFAPIGVLFHHKEDKYYALVSFKNNSWKKKPKAMLSRDIDDIFNKGIVDIRQAHKEIVRNAKDMGILKKDYGYHSPIDFTAVALEKAGLNSATLFRICPELKTAMGEKGIKHKKWNIISTDEKRIEITKKMLDKAEVLMKKIGMDKVCYGDVVLTGTLGSRVIADYNEQEDLMRLSNKIKDNNDAIKTLVHELTHRIWDKYMSDSQKEEVAEQYYRTKRLSFSQSRDVSIGDIYEIDHLGTYEVIDSEYKRKLFYIAQNVDDTTKKIRFENRNQLGEYTLIKGEKKEKDPFFVSNYSMTVLTEFFPEIVGYALTKRKDLIPWVKKILK